jgi:hypothetical protein
MNTFFEDSTMDRIKSRRVFKRYASIRDIEVHFSPLSKPKLNKSRITNQQLGYKKTRMKTNSQTSIPENILDRDGYTPSRRSQVKRTINSFTTFKVGLRKTKLVLVVLTTAVLIFGSAVLRYLGLQATINECVILCQLCSISAKMYVHLIAMNVAVSEVFLWENNSTINYLNSLDYYKLKRDAFEIEVIMQMQELYSEYPNSAAIALFKEKVNVETCKVFNDFSPTIELESCETSLGGLPSKSVEYFLSHYTQTLDALFKEWEIVPLSQRASLLLRPDFKALIPYAIQDNFGTADSIYYHVIPLLYVELEQRLLNIPRTLSLSNVLISAWIFVVLVASVYSTTTSISRLQWSFWSIVKALPIKVTSSSVLFRNWLSKTLNQNSRL